MAEHRIRPRHAHRPVSRSVRSTPRRRRMAARVAVSGLAVLATAAVVVPTVGRRASASQPVNLVIDPDFTDGGSSWTADGAAMTSAAGHDGTPGLRVTNVSGHSKTINLNDRINTVRSTVAGTTYTASVWVRVDSPASVAVREWEFKGSSRQSPAQLASAWLTSSDWKHVQVSDTAVSTGATIDLNILGWQLKPDQYFDVSAPELSVSSGPTDAPTTTTASSVTGGDATTQPASSPAATTETMAQPTTAEPSTATAATISTAEALPTTTTAAATISTATASPEPTITEPATTAPATSEPPTTAAATTEPTTTANGTSAPTTTAPAPPSTPAAPTSSEPAHTSAPSTSTSPRSEPSTTAPAEATITPSISSPGYKLVWNDEFDGTGVDKSRWNVRNNFCAGNEYSTMTDRSDNVFVSDGVLTLRALRERNAACGKPKDYTSGYLDTIGKHSWQNGRWEMRAKMSTTKGSWPAFWLRADHTIGEIDILEAVGGLPGFTSQTVLQSTNNDMDKRTQTHIVSGGLDSWHTFGLTKTATTLSWDIDGQVIYSVKAENVPWLQSMFDSSMNIRLNQQVGGVMPRYWRSDADDSSRFPSDYQIDYVRVFQN